MEKLIMHTIWSNYEMPVSLDTSFLVTMEERIREAMHSSFDTMTLDLDPSFLGTMEKHIIEVMHSRFVSLPTNIDTSFLATMEESIRETIRSSFICMQPSIASSFIDTIADRIREVLHSSSLIMPFNRRGVFPYMLKLRIQEAIRPIIANMMSHMVQSVLTQMEEHIQKAIHSSFVSMPPSLASSFLGSMEERFREAIHSCFVCMPLNLDPSFLATMEERIWEGMHSSFVSMPPSLPESFFATIEERIKEAIHSSFVCMPPKFAPSFLAKMEEHIREAIYSRYGNMPLIINPSFLAIMEERIREAIKSRLKWWYLESYEISKEQFESQKSEQSDSEKSEEHQEKVKKVPKEETYPTEIEMESDFSWMVPIQVMLGSLNHKEVEACSISSVPDKLQEANEDAYKPGHISIGPLHRGASRHLQLMEEPKWHYMRKFLERQPEQHRGLELRLRDCGFVIHKLDIVICASYGGSNNKIIKEMESHEITKIMMVDGCFLLELLIRLGDYMKNQSTTTYINDPIFQTEEKVLSVLNDIAMLENQIPFIVLKKLYRKVFPDGSKIKDDHRVADIVREAFGYPLSSGSGGAHILHLLHVFTVEQNQPHEGKKAKLELLCCATKLRASGVTIRAKINSEYLNQHKLVDMFDFGISFNDFGELEIPPLHVKETTEVKWRNLIAWEQNKIWIRCKYTSYALFFKGLICCAHDIELLLKKGVIVNDLNKSNEDLLKLFHTISKGVEHMDLSYSEICERLNVYDYKGMKVNKVLQKLSITTWHQCRCICEIIVYYGRNWYNILIRDHIPSVWKFIGIMAAATLLVLTIMQTYYSSRIG